MTETDPKSKRPPAKGRKEQLAEALRANLRRRKTPPISPETEGERPAKGGSD